MNWYLPVIGEYAMFWAVDRVCKYYVKKDYEKRYQIWRSESEILVFLIVAWSAWFRWIPWISILLTLLTWLASVPNEGQQILFKGRILLIGPVIKKSINNTLKHYRNLRNGSPGACENASLIERTVFSVCILLSYLREMLIHLYVPFAAARERIRIYWKEMLDNYHNMEFEVPHQSFAATHKSVSFDSSPTVFTFSPPQMTSTPNNIVTSANNHDGRTSAPHEGNRVTPTGILTRRISLRRQAKAGSQTGFVNKR